MPNGKTIVPSQRYRPR